MNTLLERFNRYLRLPPSAVSRVLLVCAAAALVAAMFQPLWRIRLVAPQYAEGLSLHIYAYKLSAGNGGQDLPEINNLNHYIGMKPIAEADFIEMRWVPFALGAFVLLALRAAVVGSLRSVLDLLVMYSYFTAFSLGSFYYRLYTYGHQLDPRAPMRIEPFTPVLFGRQQIANFVQTSYPQIGALWLGVFAVLLVAVLWLSRQREGTP